MRKREQKVININMEKVLTKIVLLNKKVFIGKNFGEVSGHALERRDMVRLVELAGGKVSFMFSWNKSKRLFLS